MTIEIFINDKSLIFFDLEKALLYVCQLEVEFSVWVNGGLFLVYNDHSESGKFVTTLID